MRIHSTQIWVHDQDEALEFWTNKVGMELRSDVTLPEMGDFRWLTVGWADQSDVSLVLMKVPGPPMVDEAVSGAIADLMGMGYAGTIFLATDDCQKTYEEMSDRGVEFVDAPFDTPYGIDSSFRDPSGNSIRVSQLNGNW
ncbi:MAG: VOC family protein [Ilumatobacteraceae bacterium]